MARTDRTFACLACRQRLWPVVRCPTCKDTKSLVDLSREPDAASRASPRSSAPAHILGGVGISLGGPALAALASGNFGLGEALLVPAALLLGGAFVAHPRTPPWSLPDAPDAREGAVTLTGVARARHGLPLLRSPIGDTACIAYRLVGRAGAMPIDDACACPFDLELSSGERVAIEARVATIALPIAEDATSHAVEAHAEPFLRARGVTSLADVRVRQAVLESGARVVIRGSSRADASTSRLVDGPRASLVVRPASETEASNEDSRDTSA